MDRSKCNLFWCQNTLFGGLPGGSSALGIDPFSGTSLVKRAGAGNRTAPFPLKPEARKGGGKVERSSGNTGSRQ